MPPRPCTGGPASSTCPTCRPTAKIDRRGLDSAPRITTLIWRGPDRGLTDALAARPIIDTLHWHKGPAEVDLTGSQLETVAVYGDSLRAACLPDGVCEPKLQGAPRITAARQGHWINLVLAGPDQPSGLDALRSLWWDVDGAADAASLTRLPCLETLTIRWRKPPGELLNPQALGELKQLQNIQFIDGYGVEPTEIPKLPSLAHVQVDGVTRSAAREFKARFTGARVRGAKSDLWIAANLDNPLRDWVDDHQRAGQAACKAYAKGLKAPDEPALRTFIQALNTIDEKYEIIDTIRREQAWGAFATLAHRAGMPEQLAADRFDEWRDF